MSNAEKFKEAHPYYTDGHVFSIQKHAEENEIPFCDFCKDWHFVGEEHSI